MNALDRVGDPEVAEALLEALVLWRNRQRELRRWASPPWFGPLGHALIAVAQGAPAVSSVGGTPLVRVEGWVTVQEAAAETGRSEQWITRLARAHRITARKRGRQWQIDLESAVGVCGRRRRPDGFDAGLGG